MRSRFPLSIIRCLTAAVSLCTGVRAPAQSGGTFSIEAATIDSGGSFSLSGTTGQPDAGLLAGGTFAVHGGFWSIISIFPSEGAPFPTLEFDGPRVLVSWPESQTQWHLEAITDLVQWNPVKGAPQIINGEVTVTVIAAAPRLFFRLVK